ncbi:NADP-dependent glyceraldehyde-3-phosphate dehydrogenase [Streptococcus pneumoniae]|nr:NADP-dependent glyceraldehyde-3-phosphate dehydrogenase [Streptococcus pneumoniae]
MTQTEADEAMQAARAALPAWRALSAVERAAYLHKTAAILERDKEEIGTILAKEVALKNQVCENNLKNFAKRVVIF